jgi:hypothetical protein
MSRLGLFHPRGLSTLGQGACLVVTLAAAAGALGTEPMKVDVAECGQGVRLLANGIDKAELLKRMSQAWNFQLDMAASPASTVHIDAFGRPDELVSRLLESDSFMLLRQPDPRCPGSARIARVIIIGSATVPAHAQARAPALAGPSRVQPAVSPQAAALVQSYLHSHSASHARPPQGRP